MGFFAWIIVGGLAGVLARYIMKEEGGLARNIVLGIIGSGRRILNRITWRPRHYRFQYLEYSSSNLWRNRHHLARSRYF